MATYKPHNSAHAIEQAVVGIRLLNDVDESAFVAAVQKATELQVEFNLPGRMEVDPMSLMFGRQVLTMGYRTGSVELKPGVLFQYVNSDGSMARELSIERSAVTLRTREYDRWSSMERLITGLLAPVASALCEAQFARITAVELRCVDRFVAPADSQPELLDAVSAESPLVAKYLLGKSDYLHSHIGWFEGASDEGRMLINLNIDVGGDAEQRALSVLQVISNQSSGINQNYYGEGQFGEVLLSALNRNHARDKALLGSILTADLAKEIGLEGASGVDAL